MRLSEVMAAYFKSRVVSWLTTSYVSVACPSPTGPVVLAHFHNGRYFEPDVPDGVPADWQRPADGSEGTEQAP